MPFEPPASMPAAAAGSDEVVAFIGGGNMASAIIGGLVASGRPGDSILVVDPGETKTVPIPLKASQLAYWDTGRKAFVVEKEAVRLVIGASAADLRLRAEIQVR